MKITLYIPFLFILAVAFSSLHAQELLLEKNVDESVYHQKKGIMQAGQIRPLIGAGFFLSTSSGDMYKPVSSRSFTAGGRYVRVITNAASAGISFQYQNNRLNIRQKDGKLFPDTIVHQKEIISTDHLYTDIFGRAVLKKVYGKQGIYLDAGVFATLLLNSRLIMYDDLHHSPYQGAMQKLKIRKLDYVSDWNAGLLVRLGYHKFALTTRYRMTPFWGSAYDYPQPPSMVVGIEYSL